MDDLEKAQPTTVGKIVVVILGIVTGMFVTAYSLDTESAGLFFGVMAVMCVVATGFFYIVYMMSLEQQDKRAQDERTAQAATEYLRDKQRSGTD